MANLALIPITATLVFGGGFIVNEWSHGAMSEAVSLGHHHMLDYGGYHCVGHNDSIHQQHHGAHMHGNESMNHVNCPGGEAMHQGRMGSPTGG